MSAAAHRNPPAAGSAAAAVAWHDCECGRYAADIGVWARLAADSRGPVLDLGAGTGRVSLPLAGAGHEVTAVDRDERLLDELARRAGRGSGRVAVHRADARELDLDRRFALAIAPMQLVQLAGGAGGRAALLRSVTRHLEPGGRFAAALLAGQPASGDDERPPVPDVLERDGWIYSSLPLDVRELTGALEIRRLRQAVSPTGELSEAVDLARLDLLDPGRFEAEAEAAGLDRADRIPVPATADHVGSTVVVLERR